MSAKRNNTMLMWIVVFIITALVFYGLNHFIMSSQGLPLNLDLTPAQ